MSDVKYRKYEPRFHVTRVVDDRLVGFWSVFRGEPPQILRDFDNWFEWARWTCERRMASQAIPGATP